MVQAAVVVEGAVGRVVVEADERVARVGGEGVDADVAGRGSGAVDAVVTAATPAEVERAVELHDEDCTASRRGQRAVSVQAQLARLERTLCAVLRGPGDESRALVGWLSVWRRRGEGER